MAAIGQWLEDSLSQLEQAGIASARLDCLVLLEDALEKERSWILANLDHTLSQEQLRQLRPRLQRRLENEPLAYIRNKTQFYGRDFYIDERVLEPRPETEVMVELLKDTLRSNRSKTRQPVIIDIGTGSGVLAITAKLEVGEAKVYATDISRQALAVATKNADTFGVNVGFHQGDLIEPLSRLLDPEPVSLLCNLPYVPDRYPLNAPAKREPSEALFGGSDGLDIYRNLFRQLRDYGIKPAYLLTESLPFQHQQLNDEAAANGFRLIKTQDLVQVFASIE